MMDIDYYNQIIIASEEKTNLKLLEELAQYKDALINQALATNPALPEYLTDLIFDENNYNIIKGLVHNPNCSLKILIKIVRLNIDPESQDALIHILRSHSFDILKKELGDGFNIYSFLSSYGWERILSSADILGKLPQDFLDKIPSQNHLLQLAGNPSLNREVIKKLIQMNDLNIDKILASNPVLNSEMLVELYRRGSLEVKTIVLSNISGAYLEHLVNDILNNPEDKIVLRGVFQNENCPSDILDKAIEILGWPIEGEVLVDILSNDNISEFVFDRIFNYLDEGNQINKELLELLTLNKNLNSEQAAILIDKYDLDVKCKTHILNGLLSYNEEILKRLSKDSNQLISAQASEKLRVLLKFREES